MDEVELHGRGRRGWLLPWSFMPAGLALAGAPPFGTGLGKAISEEALGHRGYWFGPLLFVVVPAATGGAVLRAGARIWVRPRHGTARQGRTGRPGESEDQDTREMPVEEHHVRGTLLAPLALLLATALAVGAVPAVPRAVSRAAAGFLDVDGYVRQALEGTPASSTHALPEAAWTMPGVVLGLLSTALAVGVAALALWGPRLPRAARSATYLARRIAGGLRRAHSGYIGDYVAWLFLGTAALAGLIGLPLL